MKIFKKLLLTSSLFAFSSTTFAGSSYLSIHKKTDLEFKDISEKKILIADNTEDNIESYVGFDTLKITVTGTRTERAIKDVPNFITSYDYDEINDLAPLNWRDLFKYDASISSQDFMRSDGERTYATGDKGNINIRGLEGNRVLTLIDGIPIPRFSYGRNGTYAASRLNYIDFNNLGSVEVLKGPGSSLYGSEAMAGVVSLRGLIPDDLLEENQNSSFEISSPYNSQNSSYQPSIKYAFRDNDIAGIFSIGLGSYSELNRNTDSKYINDLDGDIESYYIKFIKTNGNTDYNLTFENLSKDATTLGSSYYNSEENLDSQKDIRESERTRISLGFSYKSDKDKFIDKFSGQIYSNVMENKSDYETVAADKTKENTKVDLDQEMIGGNLQFINNIKTNNTSQKLTYGVEINHNDAQRTRDEFIDDILSGSYKSNPDSDILKLGFYVQDEIKFKKWDLIAGVRYDANNIDAYDDDKWYDSAIISYGQIIDPKAAGKPISKDFSHVTPSLAAIYRVNNNVNFYGKYSMGYRAPSWEDLNSSFINLNPGFSYSTVGNPDLKKETSNNYELGLKGRTNKIDFGIATFYNKYSNFLDKGRLIEGETITYEVGTVGVSPFAPPIDNVAQVYRTMNIKEANIYGIEADYKYHFTQRNKGLSFTASASLVEGRNEDDDERLDSINPFKAITNFNYLFPNNKFSLSLTNTYVGVPTPSDSYWNSTTSAGTSLAEYAYLPDSYITTDLTLKYKSSERFIADIGIYNLFDTVYYHWSDIRSNGISGSDDKAYQRYAQPGISLKAGFRYRF